jgi:hypothetical protein
MTRKSSFCQIYTSFGVWEKITIRLFNGFI